MRNTWLSPYIHAYFQLLTISYLTQQEPVNVTMEYTMYLEYCLVNAKTSRLQYNEVLQKFAASPNANRFAKTILAILTEQSKILVDGADFKNLTNFDCADSRLLRP